METVDFDYLKNCSRNSLGKLLQPHAKVLYGKSGFVYASDGFSLQDLNSDLYSPQYLVVADCKSCSIVILKTPLIDQGKESEIKVIKKAFKKIGAWSFEKQLDVLADFRSSYRWLELEASTVSGEIKISTMRKAIHTFDFDE